MPRQNVRTLWVDTVLGQSVTVDWRERLGMDMEGWQAWEAFRCGECGKVVVVDQLGECRHSDIDDGACDGVLYPEGPMMNYYYPLPDLRGGGCGECPEEAARRLVDLPVCVVEIDEGYGLALTGGGMDLSWEICEAFMRVGYLPPLHFCDLPEYCGKRLTPNNRWIVAGCRRSAQVAAEWGRRKGRKLRALKQRMEGENGEGELRPVPEVPAV